MARLGAARNIEAGHGAAGHGEAWPGKARLGAARTSRRGGARPGEETSRRGAARHGSAWHGTARRGAARRGAAGLSSTAMRIKPEDVVDEVCDRLRACSTIADAALLSGVSRNTHYSWMRKGKGGEEPYASYRREIQAAISASKEALIATVAEAAGIGCDVDPQTGRPRPAPSKIRTEMVEYQDGSVVRKIIEEREPARWADRILTARYPHEWGRQVVDSRVSEVTREPVEVVFVEPRSAVVDESPADG